MLEVKNISFSYTPEKKVINSVSFNLEQGKMMALIGESGSGKSTILKLIYGILSSEEGEIYYNNTKLLGCKENLVPGEPEFKYLEQDFGLMPYSTVGENVGNFISNINRGEKEERIKFLLNLVEMTDYINMKANDLSGGQKQRVALAKVLAHPPLLLLLDEPFSQVDTFKKNILKRAVFDFAKENNISIILATHEVEDAWAFADEMAIIKDGKIEQKGNPSYIYNNPENEYVAHLFGEHTIFNKENEPEIFEEIEEDRILVYPHQIYIADEGLKVKILRSYFLGSHYLIECINKLNRIWFTCPIFLFTGQEFYIKVNKYQKISN
ncbi:ABC transporter ATP-binding protein [Apibacter adventoris]|uniref:ABC transporter ATP-binding protein n=1 Tax=Apibacter adventoris TaxID=1679466 RepID=A0A2S8AFZ6_9FLAO|nr:ABC transporter ATP-binding protein [Apibacter adventoris]PQL95068.1 ABC transporter ATP-binding protein [Apibacter adventoris]